jgi:branched-chain amino acid aminotransferase
VFETLRVYGGAAAGEEAHVSRLIGSAKTLGLPLPPRPVIVSRLREAVAASRLREAVARLAVHAPVLGRAAVMSCLVRPFDGCPEDWYACGVAVVTAAVRRPGPRETAFQVKGSDYMNALTGLLSGPAAASTASGDRPAGLDPLFLTEAGTVSETSVANLLVLKDGSIWTPPGACGILLGVTRRTVLEAARELGLGVRETPFTRHDIYNADEVFLTNAAVEVLPVVEVDRRRIAAGAPGPWGHRLRAAYLDRVRGR